MVQRPLRIGILLVFLFGTTALRAASLEAPSLSAAALSSSQVSLVWNDSNRGTSGYVIERSVGSTAGFVEIARLDSKKKRYQDDGLAAGRTFYYRVLTYKRADASSFSNIASATTPAAPPPPTPPTNSPPPPPPPPTDSTPPDAPTGLAAAASGCERVDLSWNPSADTGSGLKAYNVYRNGAFRIQVPAASNSLADTGLVASTGYTYAVSAIDNAGNQSASSSAAAATTPSCPGSNPDPTVRTHLIDTGTFGESSAIEIRGRAAEFGPKSAFIYAIPGGEKWLYTRDDLGHESRIALPGLTNDRLSSGEFVWTSNNELWIFSSNGVPAFGLKGAPAVFRQYALEGDPLPASATLISSVVVGDEYSGAGLLSRLASGALLGLWYRPNPNVNGDPTSNFVDLGLTYRSPSGSWSTLGPITVEGLPNHLHGLSMAQHPVDGSIWVFSKGDSFKKIWAIHLTETGSGLTLDWINADFITQSTDEGNGPESELPRLVSAVDTTRNTIVLAYQNAQTRMFSYAPFVKGAAISLAAIAADGSRTFNTLSAYVERISHFGMVVRNGEITLAYRPVDANDFTYDDVYVSKLGETWSTPVRLGTTANLPFSVVTYGLTRSTFGLRTTDGNVKLFEVD